MTALAWWLVSWPSAIFSESTKSNGFEGFKNILCVISVLAKGAREAAREKEVVCLSAD